MGSGADSSNQGEPDNDLLNITNMLMAAKLFSSHTRRRLLLKSYNQAHWACSYYALFQLQASRPNPFTLLLLMFG